MTQVQVGTCPNCGQVMSEGDSLSMAQGQLIHQVCPPVVVPILQRGDIVTLPAAVQCFDCRASIPAGQPVRALKLPNGKYKITCPDAPDHHLEPSYSSTSAVEIEVEEPLAISEKVVNEPAPFATTEQIAAPGTIATAEEVQAQATIGYPCPSCGAQYPTTRSLGQHKRYCTGVAPTLSATGPPVHVSQHVHEEAPAIVTKPNGHRLGFTPVFSDAGNMLIAQLKLAYPHPTLLLGPTGMGKSVLVRHVADKLGIEHMGAINMHPATNMEQLVGFQRPLNGANGIALEWADGVLTKAVRKGGIFLMEEATRSPETVSILFGLLDDGFRYWPTPQNPDADGVTVPDSFWFIATANPAGAGYTTARMDKALESRFVIFNCSEPLADEEKMITPLIGDEAAAQLMRFVTDMRGNPESYVSTRDIKLAANLMHKGVGPLAAIDAAITQKFSKHREGILALAKAHF